MIRFKCSQCGGVLEAPKSNSGEEINCLGCGKLVQIPSPPDDYFRFPCPSCGQRLKAKLEHSGKKTHCTKCGTDLIVPMPQGRAVSKPGPDHAATIEVEPIGPSSTSSPVILISAEPPSPENAHRADSKACPFCGERILAAAIKCKHCGESLDPRLASKNRERLSDARSHIAAGTVFLLISIPFIIWTLLHSPYNLEAAAMRGSDHWVFRPEVFYVALICGVIFAIIGVLDIIHGFVLLNKS